MMRVSPLRLKAGILFVLFIVAAPFVSDTMSDDLRHWVGLAHSSAPSPAALSVLGIITLVVSFSKPSLLRRLVSGTRRDALVVPLLIAVVSTFTWLAFVFFLGGLASLDRIFVLMHVVVLLISLLLARFVLRVPLLGKATALLAATLIAYAATGGSWYGLYNGNQSILETLLSHSAIFGAAILQWFGNLSSPTTRFPPLPGVQLALVTVATLILAAAAGWWVQRRYFSGAPSPSARFRAMAIWVVATHFVWLAMLFFAGVLPEVPRWLPFATAAIMLLIGSARSLFPLMTAIARPQDVLKAVLDPHARSDDPHSVAQLVPPTATIPNAIDRVAWIISMTGVSGEPRVLRQAEALTANGWRVVVCGFEGRSPLPKSWHFIRMPSRTPFSSNDQNAARRIHNLASWLVRLGRGNPAFSWAAHWAHSTNLLWYHIRQELVRVAREHPELRADLVIAHDYHTADIGYDVARMYGAKFSIDVHEYAREQYSNDPEWVRKEQPIIIAVQDYYLRRADLITVVCAGIGELLAKETRLMREPVTIRNVPFSQPQVFRPTGSTIRVLYHGDLSRHRYIHDIIRSVPGWRPEIELILRGGGDPAYIADLKRMIAALRIEHRVHFEPPVPFDQIVPAANSADIGLFSYEVYSPQIRLALPNKLFEYIMAGLAVCITKLDEAGRVVQQYGVGKLIPQHSVDGITETINSFTREEIDAYKRASIKASEELNWDAEKQKLILAYHSLIPSR